MASTARVPSRASSQAWPSAPRSHTQVRHASNRANGSPQLTAHASQGYRLKKNQDYGAEIALGGSLTLLGAGCARVYKTQGKANLPLSLAVVGGLATFYYQRKVREFRYGV